MSNPEQLQPNQAPESSSRPVIDMEQAIAAVGRTIESFVKAESEGTLGQAEIDFALQLAARVHVQYRIIPGKSLGGGVEIPDTTETTYQYRQDEDPATKPIKMDPDAAKSLLHFASKHKQPETDDGSNKPSPSPAPRPKPAPASAKPATSPNPPSAPKPASAKPSTKGASSPAPQPPVPPSTGNTVKDPSTEPNKDDGAKEAARRLAVFRSSVKSIDKVTYQDGEYNYFGLGSDGKQRKLTILKAGHGGASSYVVDGKVVTDTPAKEPSGSHETAKAAKRRKTLADLGGVAVFQQVASQEYSNGVYHFYGNDGTSDNWVHISRDTATEWYKEKGLLDDDASQPSGDTARSDDDTRRRAVGAGLTDEEARHLTDEQLLAIASGRSVDEVLGRSRSTPGTVPLVTPPRPTGAPAPNRRSMTSPPRRLSAWQRSKDWAHLQAIRGKEWLRRHSRAVAGLGIVAVGAAAATYFLTRDQSMAEATLGHLHGGLGSSGASDRARDLIDNQYNGASGSAGAGHGVEGVTAAQAAEAAARGVPSQVVLGPGDNPWEIARHILGQQGNANPSDAQIMTLDQRIGALNGYHTWAEWVKAARDLPVGTVLKIPS